MPRVVQSSGRPHRRAGAARGARRRERVLALASRARTAARRCPGGSGAAAGGARQRWRLATWAQSGTAHLLHAAGGGRGLASRLCGQLLARRLAAGGLAAREARGGARASDTVPQDATPRARRGGARRNAPSSLLGARHVDESGARLRFGRWELTWRRVARLGPFPTRTREGRARQSLVPTRGHTWL